MSDEAGANWVAIRTIFNEGPDNMMDGRERSCLFHWEQSLQKHSKRLVSKENFQVHLDMCEVWRKSPTDILAREQANKIKRWWKENVPPENVKPLERWFKWWETRIAHWGNQNFQVNFGVVCYFFHTIKSWFLSYWHLCWDYRLLWVHGRKHKFQTQIFQKVFMPLGFQEKGARKKFLCMMLA